MNPDTRRIQVYKKAIESDFAFLKATKNLDDLYAKSIRLSDDYGYLVPVCELHTQDTLAIKRLAEWRQLHTQAYPTQFPVTIEGTKSWLRSRLLDVPDRILFFVTDKYGNHVGHLGFASCLNDNIEMEVDNVIRGTTEASPGIMQKAMEALLEWARVSFSPLRTYLHTFDDNKHAIEFYQRLGFENGRLIPLRKHTSADFISYKPLQADDKNAADKSFLEMVYKPMAKPLGKTTILTAGPLISSREPSYCLDAARNGWNSQWATYIKAFEEKFAAYLGVRFAVSTSSCTGALHLALLALGIGPDDEVIVPDITWVATANAVRYVGATPVFADIDRESWCIDPKSFESLIGPRTKAVMPVHLYGHPAKMDEVMEIARKHGLYVVEDAAPAIGAEFKGQKTGTFGDFAAFSFQGAKLAVTGEGGMLVSNNEELFKKMYVLWDQGRVPGTFWINVTGLKYKMANIQAAIGLGQLETVDMQIEKKREIFSWYQEGLKGVPHITLNHEQPWARSIYWMSSLVLEDAAGFSAEKLRQILKEKNVDTRPVFPAISQYPMWPRKQPPQPVAKYIGEHAINLPSGVKLTKSEISYVCDCIREAVAGGKR